MAGFFQDFLRGAVNGFLEVPTLKDYQHAAKTFISNGYANSPKFKWLFHVYFDINRQFVGDRNIFSNTYNPGLLVKTVELPKYTVTLTEYNQYNRKRYVQNKIAYDPVRITFHDDNGNMIRHLWHSYYSYYYNDPSQPINDGVTVAGIPPSVASSELNIRNIYNNEGYQQQQNWGYIGEIGTSSQGFYTNENNYGFRQKAPFFRSIQVFGFNQHNFVMYQLINPIIENFTHDTYDYSQTSATMEHNMSLRYESVRYYDGALNGQNPSATVPGFAQNGLYDTTLSPIARPGANKNIFGQGGLVDAGVGILEDLTSNPPNILGALQKGGRAARTFKNSQDILQTAKRELVAGAIGAISNPNSVRNVIGAFPAFGAQNNTASQAVGGNNVPVVDAKVVPVPENQPIVLRDPPN